MRAGFAALAAALVVALGVGAPAAIGGGDEKSKIAIQKLKATGATGKVTSKDSDCVGGKKVQLFRFDDYVSVKVVIMKSKANGTWRTKKDLQPGKYFASVTASSGCRYAVSKFKTLR